MAYYGQPIIEGLKGLGESIRGYGQTQMQTQLGLGQQQVELAKMEYEAPLKRLQYGTELQKYQLGAAKMKELEDQERIDAEPYPFTDIPKHIADPVAKTMRLKMVETEGGRFAQKSDGGFVTRKEMKEGGGQVATVLALTNITDPIAEVKTWTKSDNPELKQEGERLTALGPEGIVREFHNKLLQADVFLEEQGFGKVLDDKIKASQKRITELGKPYQPSNRTEKMADIKEEAEIKQGAIKKFKSGDYEQDKAKLVDDTRGYYNLKMRVMLDEDGYVKPGMEGEYNTLSQKMDDDLSQIGSGKLPSWLKGKETKKKLLTEQDIQYNMKKYGKTRKEVIDAFDRKY